MPVDADVFGGARAPPGTLLITCSGITGALLNVASMLPIAIGPSTVTPFFTNVIEELGWVQSEPWKVCALFENVMAVVFEASDTSVSIELFPLEPCQAEAAVLQGLSAQSVVPLPLKVIVPAVSITADPL